MGNYLTQSKNSQKEGEGESSTRMTTKFDTPMLNEATLQELTWIVMDDNLRQPITLDVHPYPDILGFKYVDFPMEDKTKGGALLWLQIPTRNSVIRESKLPEDVRISELSTNTKYRVGRAFVKGVQFVGNVKQVAKMAQAYQDNAGSLQSNYDPNFKYEVGEWVSEPGFGYEEPVKDCGRGVHFFTDMASAVRYGNRYGSVPACGMPIITRVLRDKRCLEVSAPRKFYEQTCLMPANLSVLTKPSTWATDIGKQRSFSNIGSFLSQRVDQIVKIVQDVNDKDGLKPYQLRRPDVAHNNHGTTGEPSAPPCELAAV
jgi:hypothetical protein